MSYITPQDNMKVQTIVLADVTNPQEVNDWFTANPSIVFHTAIIEGSLVYIFYE
jgi:hypothetical protein